MYSQVPWGANNQKPVSIMEGVFVKLMFPGGDNFWYEKRADWVKKACNSWFDTR